MNYYKIIEKLPEEWCLTMFELAETIESNVRDQVIRREDFDDLKAIWSFLMESLFVH